MKNNNQKAPELFKVNLVFAVNSQNWKSILLAAVLFLFESAVFYLYITQHLTLVPFILCHLLSVCVTILLLRYSYKKGDDLRYPYLLLFALFSAGPFGIAGFLLLAILYPFFSLFSTPFVKWFSDLFPEHEIVMQNVFERIKAGWDDYGQPHEVTPFQDFFQYGKHEDKQAVLDAIIHNFNPLYASILKQALDDQSNTVRIQAAAILEKINLDFEERLKRLIFEKENQQDSYHFELKIAHLFDAYAYSGLLEPKRVEENQKDALFYYKKYLKANPKDIRAQLDFGRLLFKMDLYQECIDWYEELNRSTNDIPANFHSWYLEALYKLHEYEKLSSEARSIKDKIKDLPLSNEITETIDTWAAHGQ